MPHDDIGAIAVLVWNHNGNNGTAEISDSYFVALGVLQHEKICLLSVYSGLKVLTLQTTDISVAVFVISTSF